MMKEPIPEELWREIDRHLDEAKRGVREACRAANPHRAMRDFYDEYLLDAVAAIARAKGSLQGARVERGARADHGAAGREQRSGPAGLGDSDHGGCRCRILLLCELLQCLPSVRAGGHEVPHSCADCRLAERIQAMGKGHQHDGERGKRKGGKE